MSDRDLPVIVTPTSLAAPNYSAIPQHFTHPGISLVQLWSIVWARRRFSFVVMVVAVILAVVITKLMPKTYEATASLMVDYEVNDPLSGKEFPVSLMGSYMSTQIQLIKSPAVLMPVIEKLGLFQDKRYAGFKGDPALLPEWVRDQFYKDLTVEQGEFGSQLIYISVNSNDPQKAALAANTVGDVYAQQQFQRLTTPASDRADRYSKQIDELKERVDQAQQDLTRFRQQTGLVESDGKADLDMARLGTLEDQLLRAQETRRTAESRTVGDQATRDATLASSSVQTLKSELNTQNAQLAQMTTTMGARHPQVLQLRSQIDATQRALNAEMRTYSGNTSTQIAEARSLERDLQNAVEAERTRVLALRKTMDEAAKFELELKTAQTLYDRALNGYDQIMLTSGGGYNNVRFISRANPPVKAAKPKPFVNLVLALGLGGMIGVVGPLVYELFNRRIRCRDDLDRDFGIPVLGEFGPAAALGAA